MSEECRNKPIIVKNRLKSRYGSLLCAHRCPKFPRRPASCDPAGGIPPFLGSRGFVAAASESADSCAVSVSRRKVRPLLHQLPPPCQEIAKRVRLLDCRADRMGEAQFHDSVRRVSLFAGPLAGDGTRCSIPAFMRVARMCHSRASQWISSHFAQAARSHAYETQARLCGQRSPRDVDGIERRRDLPVRQGAEIRLNGWQRVQRAVDGLSRDVVCHRLMRPRPAQHGADPLPGTQGRFRAVSPYRR